MTLIISVIATLVMLFAACHDASAQQPVVRISGRVTDFSGNPMGGASVFWQNESFDDVCSAVCDSTGHYEALVPAGRHYCVSAVNMRHYPKSDQLSVTSPDDMRLEFWAWNYIAERDTTLDIRYHRMEAYGINIFQIQGATPAYQIYVRPMSLTRTAEWIARQSNDVSLAPPPELLDVKVWIDGVEADVLMKQQVKEYFSAEQTGTAYLITVSYRPPRTPYTTFRIQLTDMENGDQGEGICHYERFR